MLAEPIVCGPANDKWVCQGARWPIYQVNGVQVIITVKWGHVLPDLISGLFCPPPTVNIEVFSSCSGSATWHFMGNVTTKALRFMEHQSRPPHIPTFDIPSCDVNTFPSSDDYIIQQLPSLFQMTQAFIFPAPAISSLMIPSCLPSRRWTASVRCRAGSRARAMSYSCLTFMPINSHRNSSQWEPLSRPMGRSSGLSRNNSQ